MEPERLDAMLLLESKIPASAKQFIALPASTMLSVEAPYYSKHPERYVFLVSDSVAAHGTMSLGQYSAMRVWTLDDLKIHARETILVNPQPETVAALKRAGYKATDHVEESLEVVTVE